MSGALRIATLFGIPVRIHWTFLLIFIYLFSVGAQQGWDISNTLWSVLFVLVLFLCVVLHEFGHALTARRYGVHTRDIILSPIGGVARLDHLPEKPVQEFLVAIAGPAVNVVIALLISPYLLTLRSSDLMALFQSILNPESNFIPIGINQLDYFLAGLLLLNVMLAVFNMLPAFPMDGGRVLRALLSTRMERHQATRISAYIGQMLALGIGIYGIFIVHNFFYPVIGTFVFLAAASEYKMVRQEHLLRQYRVGQATRTAFKRLYTTDTIGKAIQQLSQDGQQSYLVLNPWQDVVGILTEKHITDAHKSRQYDLRIDQCMSPVTDRLFFDDNLDDALQRFNKSTAKTFPVYGKYGELVGMLDLHGLDRFMRFIQKGKG